jgi:hypothetical protein
VADLGHQNDCPIASVELDWGYGVGKAAAAIGVGCVPISAGATGRLASRVLRLSAVRLQPQIMAALLAAIGGTLAILARYLRQKPLLATKFSR